MDENILGIAKSYLEENGIDTSMMTAEEIIDKYYEMTGGKEEEIEAEDNEEQPEMEEEVEYEETADNEEELAEDNDIDQFLAENKEIYNTLNEEQKLFVDQLLEMLK